MARRRSFRSHGLAHAIRAGEYRLPSKSTPFAGRGGRKVGAILRHVGLPEWPKGAPGASYTRRRKRRRR